MAFAKLFSFDLYHALQNLGPFLRFKLCDTLIKLFRSISEILDGNNEVLQIWKEKINRKNKSAGRINVYCTLSK